MGGWGSGNYRFNKKAIVEDAWCLTVRDLNKGLYPGACGTLTWMQGDFRGASMHVSVTGDHESLTVTLGYAWGNEEVEIPIRMDSTPTQFGGKRWWFICPLAVNGKACDRRVRKLYVPSGAKYFGCRKCHDLTYQSCQEAHQAARMFRDWAAEDPSIREIMGF